MAKTKKTAAAKTQKRKTGQSFREDGTPYPTPLYKVLKDGGSCHGGDLKWNLPVDGKPGDWHEVDGVLMLCSWGPHLTDAPAHWWGLGHKAYLVEADGVVGECSSRDDRKVVARRVRLVRELAKDELAALNVFVDGDHAIKEGLAHASGSASVKASGSASVKAYDSASVKAYGSASVKAEDRVVVVSWRGSPTVVLTSPRAAWVDQRNDAPKMTIGTVA